MSPPRARRGVSMVEVLVAAGVLSLVAVGTWMAFTGVQRQSHQVLSHLGALQAASSIEAQLALDAASMLLPTGSVRSIQIGEEGRSLSFLITPRSPSPETHSSSGGVSYRVHWSLESSPGGASTLVREIRTPGHEKRTEWASAPVAQGRFLLRKHEGPWYLQADLLFRPQEREGSSRGGGLPLRWLYRIPTRVMILAHGSPPRELRIAAPVPEAPVLLEEVPWNP